MSYFRTNTCTFVAIARMLNIINNDPYIVNGKPSQDTRLQFRAHLVAGQWSRPYQHNLHGSVHHPDLAQSWYSAYPEKNPLLAYFNDAGNLIKHDSDDLDSVDNTPVMGYINITTGQSLTQAWSDVQNAFGAYDNSLPYCLYPEKWDLSDKCHGYNSNSFAVGLAHQIGNITPVYWPAAAVISWPTPQYFPALTIPVSEEYFPGAGKPVPDSAFQ